jgi:hypothetical protein
MALLWQSLMKAFFDPGVQTYWLNREKGHGRKQGRCKQERVHANTIEQCEAFFSGLLVEADPQTIRRGFNRSLPEIHLDVICGLGFDSKCLDAFHVFRMAFHQSPVCVKYG